VECQQTWYNIRHLKDKDSIHLIHLICTLACRKHGSMAYRRYGFIQYKLYTRRKQSPKTLQLKNNKTTKEKLNFPSRGMLEPAIKEYIGQLLLKNRQDVKFAVPRQSSLDHIQSVLIVTYFYVAMRKKLFFWISWIIIFILKYDNLNK